MYMGFKLNPLVLVPLVSSIVGLILIYVATINLEPKRMKISDITHEMIGRTVSTTGKIIYRKIHPAGHLFLTISDDNVKIQVPLFVGFMNSLSESGLTEENLKVGTNISVSGLVDEYRDQLQIIPRKIDDIKILIG
jgi:DNA/RNA endonuclease YhcR with UshA esterase domain